MAQRSTLRTKLAAVAPGQLQLCFDAPAPKEQELPAPQVMPVEVRTIAALQPAAAVIVERSARSALAEADADAVLSDKQVRALTSLGRTTIWQLSRDGRFPARVRLSPKRSGWRRSEVVSWLADRERA